MIIEIGLAITWGIFLFTLFADKFLKRIPPSTIVYANLCIAVVAMTYYHELITAPPLFSLESTVWVLMGICTILLFGINYGMGAFKRRRLTVTIFISLSPVYALISLLAANYQG